MKTRILATHTEEDREKAVAAAVEMLRAGRPVALPTETVYGLAAPALDPEAVLRIFATKERPRFDPLIIHIAEKDWLERVTSVPSPDKELVTTLIERFWPGPFTLVLDRQPLVPDVVTAGLPTVAVRMSSHPILQSIIRGLGQPLAAPSANRFGRISPTTAGQVLTELNGRIQLIIDGGPTTHGLESTIVAVRNGRIEILRPGPITREQLAPFAEVRFADVGLKPEAPGQLRSHYAPQTRLVMTTDLASFASPVGKRVGALTLRKPATEAFAALRILSVSGDLTEAAANLFRSLRELDEAGLDLIVAEAIPEDGLGAAIMDRLRRAAAR